MLLAFVTDFNLFFKYVQNVKLQNKTANLQENGENT